MKGLITQIEKGKPFFEKMSKEHLFKGYKRWFYLQVCLSYFQVFSS